MTYSIIARCPRTGRLGIGTTTTSLACGRRNESVRPNVGSANRKPCMFGRMIRVPLTCLRQATRRVP